MPHEHLDPFGMFDETWEAVLKPGLSRRFFRFDEGTGRDLPRFQAAIPGYSPVNAWWLSELSRLIYVRDADEEAGGFGRSGFLSAVDLREYCFINGDGVQCALVTSCDNVDTPFAALVFRGTSAFETWLSNLNTIQSGWRGGGLVHAGFKSEFFRIWDAVERRLSEVPPRFPLFYTGHSLGGAMAVLAAGLRPPSAVYTFGSPRVGDAVFVRSLQAVPIFRVVNHRDLVAWLPPSRIPFEFRHAGECRHYRNGVGPDDPCLPLPEAPAIASNGNGGRRGGASPLTRRLMRPPEFLSSHAPVNYSRRLAQEILSI